MHLRQVRYLEVVLERLDLFQDGVTLEGVQVRSVLRIGGQAYLGSLTRRQLRNLRVDVSQLQSFTLIGGLRVDFILISSLIRRFDLFLNQVQVLLQQLVFGLQLLNGFFVRFVTRVVVSHGRLGGLLGLLLLQFLLLVLEQGDLPLQGFDLAVLVLDLALLGFHFLFQLLVLVLLHQVLVIQVGVGHLLQQEHLRDLRDGILKYGVLHLDCLLFDLKHQLFRSICQIKRVNKTTFLLLCRGRVHFHLLNRWLDNWVQQ